jgi:hypothetical protein
VAVLSPSFAVFVMMNNYFHDVATAMLAACALTMRLFMARFGRESGSDAFGLLRRLHLSIGRIVRFSFGWVIVSGAIRIGTFGSFEWPNAVQKGQTYGLLAKYALALFMIVFGAFLWGRVSRKMKKMGHEIGREMGARFEA